MPASYTLHHSPFTCSFAVQAILEKLALPYELKKVDIYKQEHRTPEFLALNPLAQVPVLTNSQLTLTQASAIMLYLSEQHPESQLMPAIGSADRAAALQMLFYFSNTLHPYFWRLFYPERYSKSAPEEVKQQGIHDIQQALKMLDQRLAQQEYCAGNQPYAPDYYLFTICNWLRVHPIDVSGLTHLKGFIKRMKALPEIQTVLEREMQSWAA